MDFQIRITEEGLADLEEILGYSWQHFPEFTNNFGEGLLAHIEMLQRFPYTDRRVAKRAGVRQLVHAPFLVDYFVDEQNEAVEILRVWQWRAPPDLSPLLKQLEISREAVELVDVVGGCIPREAH